VPSRVMESTRVASSKAANYDDAQKSKKEKV
jgi:hypothetical protein